LPLAIQEQTSSRTETREPAIHRTLVYTNLDELEALRPAWEDLLGQFPGATTFSTWEWLAPWWRAFGQGRELRVLAFFDESEQLVGLAPLAIHVRRIAPLVQLRVLSLCGDGSGDSDNLDIPVRAGWENTVAAALLNFLKKKSEQWDLCEFNTMPADSPIASSLAKPLDDQGWRVDRDRRTCSAIPLPRTWQAYLNQLSRKERGKIAYYRKRLERKSRVCFYRCESEREIPEYLEKLFLLHRKRWQSLKQKGSFECSARRQFYRELATSLIARRKLEFWLLDLDGETVAAQFGFFHGSTVFQLQEGFDPTYFSDSVGYVLRAYVMEQLISRGVRRYDFLAGEAPSKSRWDARLGHYLDLKFARPFSRGGLYLRLSKDAGMIKEWMRGHLPTKYWRALQGIAHLKRHVLDRSSETDGSLRVPVGGMVEKLEEPV
jgi:CelD/BcsL family acetyltransferase involved in cellulose biosynthesis